MDLFCGLKARSRGSPHHPTTHKAIRTRASSLKHSRRVYDDAGNREPPTVLAATRETITPKYEVTEDGNRDLAPLSPPKVRPDASQEAQALNTRRRREQTTPPTPPRHDGRPGKIGFVPHLG